MAKHSAPSAKAAKEPKAAKAVRLPTFDEHALSTLTEQLDRGLQEGRTLQTDSSSRRKDHHVAAAESKKTTEHGHSQIVGKKRDSKGNIKESRSNNSRVTGHDRLKGTRPDQRELLLKEILALGGTEDDLDLVGDVISDEDQDELTQPASPDTKFTKALSKFVIGLGIDQTSAVLTESESEITEDEDWEEESIQSQIESSDKVAPKEDHRSSEKEKKILNRLLFEARPDWHAAPLAELPVPDLSETAPYRETIVELKKYALTLLETDSSLYASKHLSSTSSHRFLSTIMSSGTLSDKVSALTLVVQESPVHTAKSLESLLALAKKRSRGQAVTALGAIKDLLGQGVVLPADRRLRPFSSQPGLLGTLQRDPISDWKIGNPLPGHLTGTHLISWAYEDWLKETYFDMLKVLEGWCNDEVEYARGRAVTYVFELLREKPEQESNLLRLLVNKLGDPDKKIASRTSYLILQLQTTHPLMKPIIVRAIESELLLRPGQSSHAKYYAINTLNQTILSGKEEDVARKLLHIYFELFVTLLKKPDLQKPLVGPIINKKGQVQGGGGQKGRKAQEKATKEEAAKQASEETTEKMISAVLTGVNRAFPFAKSDDLTLEKHMDMLFRITHSSNFNTSIQALMLIQQLASSKHLAVERFYRTLYESLLDHRLITSSKHAMYLNLLFRSLKSDLNLRRVKAFAKRLLQVITLHQPPFICGVLYLLRELETTFPGLASFIVDPEEHDDVDEEVFKDVPEDASMVTQDVSHSKDDNVHPGRILIKGPTPDGYDGRKRNPEHSNADKSCLWELLPFLSHFHPSVSMFAGRLLAQSEMPAKPDLASHTLIHFLDRFVYRNAKGAAGNLRGASIMQPLAGGESRGVLVSNRLAIHSQKPLNSEEFWRKKAEDVAADEVFFHKYFNQMGKSKQSRKTKTPEKVTANVNSDDEEENGEDEIWQALVESRPEVEGDSDDESDLEMLDLEDSDQGSSIESGSDLEDLSGREEASGDSDIDNASDFGSLGSDKVQGEDDTASDLEELFNQELETAEDDEVKKELDAKREERKNKRRKFKNLPTFASAEDYAEMMLDDEEDI